MSTKIFTNEGENTLLNKFKGIAEDLSDYLEHFDALVGYLYASGYFKIRPFLADIAQIRLLVGIETDRLIKKYQAKGQEFLGGSKQTKDEFLTQLKDDIQTSKYRQNVEEGILQLVDDIITGKVKIKAHPSKKIHSKVYIFRSRKFSQHAPGAVITGSSNLTRPGLEGNLEFNVLLHDYAEVKFATDTFEKLWLEAVDILPADVKYVKRDTYLNSDRTPFEIYIKLLIEYFGDSVNYDATVLDDLPQKYDKLAYQADAIKEGYKRLKAHNGFILADVVGLGKTVIAAAIIKKYIHWNGFQSRVLVVHPPAVKDNWEMTINDFGLGNYVHFVTNGSLHKIIESAHEYDMVVVDESHKFRSDTSQMYQLLQLICKTPRSKKGGDRQPEKKVMLLSATPLNNRPEDIANQIYLFQNTRQSTIEGEPNLQAFFAPLISEYKTLRRAATLDQPRLRQLYGTIKERVLRPLVIRRTRNDIMKNDMYREDMQKQGVVFPAIPDPTPVMYQFDAATSALFEQTVQQLTDTQNGLKYFRYQAIAHLKKEEHKALYDNADKISGQLAHIMKTLLIKRLESSFEAFKGTLGRFRQRNQYMIEMFAGNKIYIAPDLDVNRYIEEGREDELEERIAELNASSPNNEVFKRSDFDKDFLPGLKADQQILDDLCQRWGQIAGDPKLDKFVAELKNGLLGDKNLEKKLVIFTESGETAQYLGNALTQRGYNRTLVVTSKNQRREFDRIRANFDAKLSSDAQRNALDFIVTTDVLAEGINLHRANAIVNYDVPWNSTRLMQRIGRVNRLGTKAAEILIYNFFPTSEADDKINLQNTVLSKLQGFHTAFGEDSKIYSPGEQLEENVLDEISNDEAGEDDKHLEYLSFLRKYKEENPKDFRRIKKLPLRSRTGRAMAKFAANKPAPNNGQKLTIAYLKTSRRSGFYITDGQQPKELTFSEALQIFEAKKPEKHVALITEHYAHVKAMEAEFHRLMIVQSSPRLTEDKMSAQERGALATLKIVLKHAPKDSALKTLAKTATEVLKMGIFRRYSHELNRLNQRRKDRKRNMKLDEVMAEAQKIIDKYPIRQIYEARQQQEEVQKAAEQRARKEIPEIIISESFG
ncbi:helicase-related protein [Microscilla marina]|uniref:ATP-dependent helicase n=1 Tax=Microscilla marina ATCC 23134 TaxID=313606 RepID=A1ZWE6_MICM2|nr:helicase-related protein [Microscilla marina]EAY25286.1 ATP-dependent helicase [Microscilla marina ATCC 23134]